MDATTQVMNSPETEVAVVDVKDVAIQPRKKRLSAFDGPAAELLKAGKGKGIVIPVPKGQNLDRLRSYAYTALQRSMGFLKPGTKNPVSIKVTTDGDLLAWLTDGAAAAPKAAKSKPVRKATKKKSKK